MHFELVIPIFNLIKYNSIQTHTQRVTNPNFLWLLFFFLTPLQLHWTDRWRTSNDNNEGLPPTRIHLSTGIYNCMEKSLYQRWKQLLKYEMYTVASKIKKLQKLTGHLRFIELCTPSYYLVEGHGS